MRLKDILEEQGIEVRILSCIASILLLTKSLTQAEFINGVLVCDDGSSQVAVRKSENRFAVEGSISELYFKVRDILYSQFAIV